MRDQIVALEALQSIDIELRELEANLEEYPKIISNLEQELTQAKDSIEAQKSLITEQKTTKSRLELEISNNEETIKKSEEKLFEIKTHKEYEALQKEIAETKRITAGLEDELLQSMEQIEKLETEIAELEESLQEKESNYTEEISDYKQKIDDLRAVYEPKKEEHEKIVTQVKPDILPIYEKVSKRNGIALAEAKDEVCTGCNMNIPPQLFNEVLTLTRIIQCPNCKKILFCDQEKESDSPST